MNEAWIVQSKLTPPSPPAQWLTRELVAPDQPRPSLLYLTAGPGYGKTLGMLSLLDAPMKAGVPVLWYTLDLYDSDPATFFHYMVAGMRRFIPQFGEEIKALLGGDRLEPRLLWQRFFQAINAYNLPEVHLAFDDFHHLQENQPEVVKALAYFFDKLPPRTHLVISSRTRLNMSLGKVAAMGRAKTLEEDALRFNSTEEVEFMRLRAPDGAIPNAWWRKATGLDGWPLGLDLLTAIEPGRELNLNPRDAGVEPLTGYVAEELYEAQEGDRRDFMLRAALLSDLTPEACRWVFGIADAAEQLEAMEATHLVRRLADNVAYRFPTYLRDFLVSEGERTLPGMQRAEWHRRAASFYQDQGQEELALPHRIASEDWEGAIVACELSFPLMRFTGRQPQIGRWLDAFPAAVTAREPVLQLWRGHLLSRTGQHVEAAPCYERARELFAARKDAAGVFKVQVRQCTIALIHQEMRKFGASILEALASQKDGKNEDVVDLQLARALAAEQRGDMSLMQACNEAVLQIPIEQNIEIAASHCIALMNLYTLGLHLGDLEAANRHIAHVIELSDTWQFAPYNIFAKFLQANLQVLEDDVDTAGNFLKGLPPHWKDMMDWHDLACAYAVLGYWHHAKGDYKEAEDLIRRSQDTFEKAGFKEGKKVSLERMLWLVVGRRQYARASDLLAEAGEGASQNIYDMVLLTPYARAQHLLGQAGVALKAYNEAIPGFEDQKADLHLARALLYQGASLLKLNDEGGAEKAVARGLQIAETRNYHFLPGADPTLWEEIAPLVTRKRLSIAFVEQSLSAAAKHAVSLTAEAPPAVRAKAKTGLLSPDVLEKPGAGGLSIRCFGGFEVRLDGVLLDQWPRRKAKLIMAALLLYPRGLGLGQIIEVMGGEEVTPAAITTMKVDVSSLRRSLEPNLGKGQESRYVITADERYALAWDDVEYLDLRAFDRAMAEGDRFRDSEPLEAIKAYEQALSHYRGNLLDDNFFAKFFEAEREKYRQQVVSVLMWVAKFHGDLGDMSSAERALVRAVELAPTEESAYIALMRHQKAVGRSERIRQVYWDCRKALKAHLGLVPSDEFEQSYAAIAKG